MKPWVTHPLSYQPPNPRPSQSGAEISAARKAGVIPSDYDGQKPGYQFKSRGEHGTGYYPLVAPEVPEPTPESAPEPAPAAAVAAELVFAPDATFVASGAFRGARAGFVFKAGEAGLGYYADALAPAVVSAAAVDVSEKASSPLDELRAAGGDVAQLAQLAHVSRTELTGALKALGFKGLRTRQRLEEELKAWQPR
jgi:hypothetical protein